MRKYIKESYFTLSFWDYFVEKHARMNNMTAQIFFKLCGLNAHTSLTVDQDDIYNLCEYGWYDWCYYHRQIPKLPINKRAIGIVMVPKKEEGNEMD